MVQVKKEYGWRLPQEVNKLLMRIKFEDFESDYQAFIRRRKLLWRIKMLYCLIIKQGFDSLPRAAVFF